mgnify:CR=1 FL=1
MDDRDELETAIASEKQKQRRQVEQNAKRKNLDEDDDDEEYGDEYETADQAQGMDDFAETLEAAVEALYTSQGRSIADVLDYHLTKMGKSLNIISKQNARILAQMQDNGIM